MTPCPPGTLPETEQPHSNADGVSDGTHRAVVSPTDPHQRLGQGHRGAAELGFMCSFDHGLELHTRCVIRGADGSELIICEFVDVLCPGNPNGPDAGPQ